MDENQLLKNENEYLKNNELLEIYYLFYDNFEFNL